MKKALKNQPFNELEVSGETFTSYQLVALFRKRFGVHFLLGREVIVSVVMPAGDESVIWLATVRAKLVSTYSEQRVTHHGARIVKIDADSETILSDETVWLPLAQPEVLKTWEVRNTPERVTLDAIAYKLCGRPGAGSWVSGQSYRLGQRDSYGRQVQGYRASDHAHVLKTAERGKW